MAVIVLLALAGALLLVESKADGRSRQTGEGRSNENPLDSGRPDQEIKLKKTGGDTTVLRRGRQQVATRRAAVSTRGSGCGQLAGGYLVHLNADKLVEDKATDLSPYGLNSPTLDVTVFEERRKDAASSWATTRLPIMERIAKLNGDAHVHGGHLRQNQPGEDSQRLAR